MDAVLIDKIQKLQKYKDRDSIAIQEDITNAVETHLRKNFPGTHVIRPNKNYFRQVYHPENGHEITDLDGILVVSNDPKDLEWQTPLINEDIVTKQTHNKKLMVLIEAKHYIDKPKVDRKLTQFLELKHYLNCAKKLASNDFTREFTNAVETFNLHDFDDVYLYIGGRVFEKDVESYVLTQSNTHADKIKLIKHSGDRYLVN